MGRIAKLLREQFESHRPMVYGQVTSVPVDTTGHSKGYVLATIGGQAGIRVIVDRDAPLLGTGDVIGAAAMGTPSNTQYTVVQRVAGARASSGMYQFPNAVTLNGQDYEAGDIVIGGITEDTPNIYIQYRTGTMFYRIGKVINGADYATGDRDFGPPDKLHWHYNAAEATLSVYNDETELSGFDGETRSIFGFERLGDPLGPSIEWGIVKDEDASGNPILDSSGNQQLRYAWRMIGLDGVPLIAMLSGTADDPDNASLIVGKEGATQRLTWIDSVLTVTGMIVATSGTIGGWTIGATALTAGSVGFASGGSIAIYAGNVSPDIAPFRVTQAGGMVATSASIIGVIGWGSGKGTADDSGIKIELSDSYSDDRAYSFTNSGGSIVSLIRGKYGVSDNEIAIRANNISAHDSAILIDCVAPAAYASTVLLSVEAGTKQGTLEFTAASISGVNLTLNSESIQINATTGIVFSGASISGGSQRYTLMGTATSGMDGLNRDTADARYARWAGELAGSPSGSSGAMYYDTSTSKVRLYANTQWLNLN